MRPIKNYAKPRMDPYDGNLSSLQNGSGLTSNALSWTIRKRVHAEQTIAPDAARRPAVVLGEVLKGGDGVFVAAFRMNGFADEEAEDLSSHVNVLPTFADEMHLNPTLALIEEGVVLECVKIECCSKLTIDPPENVEIELRGYPLSVVIGLIKNVALFDEVDTHHEDHIWSEHSSDMLQETAGLLRLEIPNR